MFIQDEHSWDESGGIPVPIVCCYDIVKTLQLVFHEYIDKYNIWVNWVTHCLDVINQVAKYQHEVFLYTMLIFNIYWATDNFILLILLALTISDVEKQTLNTQKWAQSCNLQYKPTHERKQMH